MDLFRAAACAAICTAATLVQAASVRMEAAQARPYKGGFTRDGVEVVCATAGTPEKNSGASWNLVLNQRSAIPLRISAEGKVEAGAGDGEVLLYIDVIYADGGHLWGRTAAFASKPDDWRVRTVELEAVKPIRSMSVTVITRGSDALRARFRAPLVETLVPDGADILDGALLQKGNMPSAEGFLLLDARAGGGFRPLPDAAMGVAFTSKSSENGGARFFEATLADLHGGDRALTLAWAMQLGAGRLEWFDSPRGARDVTDASGDFRTTEYAPCGAGCYSRWPILAAAVDGKGMALGFDPRMPAFSRLSLHAGLRLAYAAFDVAFTPEKKWTRVGFVVFPFEARHGFRGALEAYQRLFPEFNEVRLKKQGNWMAFQKISGVDGWEDFGFAIKEGDDETDWDDAHGIATFRYTEPTTWWMPVKRADAKRRPSMEECVAEAERLAAAGNPFAAALKASPILDANGRRCSRIVDTPWCNGIVWNLNGAPGQGPAGEFAAKYGEEHFAKSYSSPPPKGLDGEYVDSSELYITAPLDFNRANFSGMDTPLVFAAGSLRPCVFKGMIAYEYVRAVWRRVRPINRLAMANSTPHKWWWLAPHLDVMGTETNWHRERRWAPPSDGQMMYARALCGAKPYCFLMNTDFNVFTGEMAERYMRRSLAYGMYPSFFSHNAATDHYFANPKLYNRDRHLFKKYMPLCIKAGEAGWRPVNRLLSSNAPKVITEQFGERLATVFNLSGKPVRATLTSLAGAKTANELVNGGKWHFDGGRCVVDVPGEAVFLLEFGSEGTR